MNLEGMQVGKGIEIEEISEKAGRLELRKRLKGKKATNSAFGREVGKGKRKMEGAGRLWGCLCLWVFVCVWVCVGGGEGVCLCVCRFDG